jgi:hypothetical protein
MGNLLPLLDNWCVSLKTEIARKLMLWAAETRDGSKMKYKAAKYADQVDLLVLSMRPMLAMSHQILAQQRGDKMAKRCIEDEVVEDLMQFILARHANHFWGGNVKFPLGPTAYRTGAPRKLEVKA